ncbi:DUF4256 domain-containing protein [Algoriphagus resistens]|uniref:DUF4256 domain-containing protein n=1 Tax=Algoriphagus resistens TaxID=1750590 RepID=UPI000B18EDB6|nr:DUF4256 domain-containing protein [Algoriphagus resistens]
MAKTSSKGSGKPIPKVKIQLKFSPKQGEELLETLKSRFEKNKNRHKGLEWTDVHTKLKSHPKKMSSLFAMESSGGEPDVISYDKKTEEYIFCDCSEQSPADRRSICYDEEGQQKREKQGIHPGGNAVDIAAEMGIELLDEEQYRELQKFGPFDTKTESWIKTPDDIRKLGGALFCDHRYGHVFTFHNSAPSFYAARGFRGLLRV